MFRNKKNTIRLSLVWTQALTALLLLGVAGTGILSAISQLPQPFSTISATKFPKVIGWPEGKLPRVPTGFAAAVVAADIESPRWLYVLPNNDVLVSQAKTTEAPKGDPKIIEGLKQAGALGESPDQITLLRDADNDGEFEVRQVLLSGLRQPFGMAFLDDHLYVANTDAVLKFPFKPGQTSITASGQKIIDLPAGGYNNHWTRNIVFSPDETKLYISVGSQTNVDEEGLDAKEPHRAAILECNPDGSGLRVYASGLRNPNGMDWQPGTNLLWAVVNERDMLGDDLPPDFLTSIREGGFYGWPYAYLGPNEDPRHKGKRPELVEKTIAPEVLLTAHSASMGLVFYDGNSFPERYRGGAFVTQHGSWNRQRFSGYRVVFVPFVNGKPGPPVEDFLIDFIASEERSEVYGRPVGLALLRDGSLLVADDAGGRIWRVRATGS